MINRAADDADRWDHPAPGICDGTCLPRDNGTSLVHELDPQAVTLSRYRDVVAGGAFRDDTITPAGIQNPGVVGWRLQVNETVVEADLEDMERVLADQLARLREVIDALARVPRQRPA